MSHFSSQGHANNNKPSFVFRSKRSCQQGLKPVNTKWNKTKKNKFFDSRRLSVGSIEIRVRSGVSARHANTNNRVSFERKHKNFFKGWFTKKRTNKKKYPKRLTWKSQWIISVSSRSRMVARYTTETSLLLPNFNISGLKSPPPELSARPSSLAPQHNTLNSSRRAGLKARTGTPARDSDYLSAKWQGARFESNDEASPTPAQPKASRPPPANTDAIHASGYRAPLKRRRCLLVLLAVPPCVACATECEQRPVADAIRHTQHSCIQIKTCNFFRLQSFVILFLFLFTLSRKNRGYILPCKQIKKLVFAVLHDCLERCLLTVLFPLK